MSNHSSNILDEGEIVKNILPQSLFSPRWTKIERILYYAHISLFILLLAILGWQIFISISKQQEIHPDIFVVFMILSPFLVFPPIYIKQFQKFKNRNFNYQSIDFNRRLRFSVATPIFFLVSILLFISSTAILFLGIYLVSNSNLDTLVLGYLLTSIPLLLVSGFLCAYYIYSMRFLYQMDKAPIDNLLN
jgi:hypothetical protein